MPSQIIPMRFIKFHIIRPALGLDPFYVSPVYCASKHAVVGFSKSYGHEFHFKQTGVTVNAICPGPVDTGFFRVFPTKCIDVAEAKKLAAKMRPVNTTELYGNDFADGPTNLQQPTLNHVQSDTMGFAVLADPTRALQGTNRGSGLAMDETENDVGSLEQLLQYADEHYLAGKLPLGDHLGKVLHEVEEYH
ncbi:UNVERIFIED_CONTAM: 15-hydroxyprostaglandin dehydrogenase [NAD(+)] [Trichonephila clavipes]